MSPEDVVDRSYELISFAAGGEPAWAEFRSLFTEPSTLAQSTASQSVAAAAGSSSTAASGVGRGVSMLAAPATAAATPTRRRGLWR